ncbi:MAG: chloride channel protein [Clostridia bacterium]|nr:chloride channel protein [Clostridia bacterium]
MNSAVQFVKHKALSAFQYILTFLKWVFLAGFTGAVCGLVGAAFDVSVDKATGLFSAHSWMIFLLLPAGLAIIGLYELFKVKPHVGTNDIISSIRTSEKVPILLVPLVFVGTVLTHLGGGSAGREGAALQIGGGIGQQIGRLLKLDEKDLHLMTLCGMSGLFAALFGTPLTATIFAIEVISIGVVYYSALIPCLSSSLVAYFITRAFKIEGVSFKIPSVPQFDALLCVKVILLAGICAAVSILFCAAMHGSHKLFKKYIKNEFLRIAIGAVVIILLTLIFSDRRYNGTGMAVIQEAIEQGKALPYDFVLKIVFTAITIGVGFRGGEMVPTFFIGATLGCTLGSLLGINPAFAAALGFIAMFCAVMNCPIASIILSIEVFGAGGILFFAIVSAVSYLLSGYYGLYTSQKIMYSKLKAEFINMDTKPL